MHEHAFASAERLTFALPCLTLHVQWVVLTHILACGHTTPQ